MQSLLGYGECFNSPCRQPLFPFRYSVSRDAMRPLPLWLLRAIKTGLSVGISLTRARKLRVRKRERLPPPLVTRGDRAG